MFRLSDILRAIARKLFRLAVSPRPSVACRFRPGMLALEGRDVPTNLTVTVLSDASEAGVNGTVRIARDGSTASSLWLITNATGTATAGSDYSTPSSGYTYRTIPSGASYIDVSVVPIDDSSDEATETVIFAAAIYTMMGPGSWSSATMNVLDDDPTPPPPAPPTNAAPVFVSPLSTGNTITPGQPFYFQVLATDADNEWLSYTALQMPQGLSIDANTGVVTGTMAAAGAPEAGTYINMTFEVGDGTVLVQQQVEFTVTSTIDPWLVNTTDDDEDSDDVNLEDGVPLDGDGKVSLRAAIQQANHNSKSSAWPTFIEFNTTVFGGGAKTITLREKRDTVTGRVTVTGTGMANLTIAGGPDNKGIFAFAEGSHAVVTNLTIADGTNHKAEPWNGSGGGGGVENWGSLFLDGVKITGCEADHGGGIINAGGHATLLNSQVVNNKSTSTAADSFGGGVRVSNGYFVADDSLIQNNTCAVRGGGVGVNGSGAALLFDTDVIGNTATNGEGLYVSSKLTLAMLGGGVEGNKTTAGGNGAGMVAEGTVRVKNVGFNNNEAGNYGGGIDVAAGSIKVSGCTFSGNTAKVLGPMVARQKGADVIDLGGNTNLDVEVHLT